MRKNNMAYTDKKALPKLLRIGEVTAGEKEMLGLLELVLDSQLTDHVAVELLSDLDSGPRDGAAENHLHWPA